MDGTARVSGAVRRRFCPGSSFFKRREKNENTGALAGGPNDNVVLALCCRSRFVDRPRQFVGRGRFGGRLPGRSRLGLEVLVLAPHAHPLNKEVQGGGFF